MPLPTASSRAASSSGSARPAARRTGSSSNSGPATAASSSRSMVLGARRDSRWLTTSRTLSGVPSSVSGRVTLTSPPATSTIPVSTSARQSSQTRNALPPVRSWIVVRKLAQLRVGVASGGTADQIGDLRPGEPCETHSHDVVGAAQVGKRLRRAPPARRPRCRGRLRGSAGGRSRRSAPGGAGAEASRRPPNARPRARAVSVGRG